ncbi:MAG TPA: Lrp/AsnC family transcriptional regulator [archaeon]|nr:Lrp/AsnC family transcriptional regulator [archaeon]
MKAKKIILDDVNRFIISEMLKDGRIKFTALAKKLSVTPAAVKERVDRLIKNKVIRTSALINAEMFFPILSVIGIEADADGVNLLMKKLRNCPLVVYITRTSGMHNLVLNTATEDMHQLENFLTNQIRSEPGMKHIEVNIGSTPMAPEFHHIKLYYEDNPDHVPCGLRIGDKEVCLNCPSLVAKGKK